jgi:hypothetical protein
VERQQGLLHQILRLPGLIGAQPMDEIRLQARTEHGQDLTPRAAVAGLRAQHQVFQPRLDVWDHAGSTSGEFAPAGQRLQAAAAKKIRTTV